MRRGLLAGTLVLATLAWAQSTLTYRQLKNLLQSSIEQHIPDKEIAKFLKTQQLGFALTDPLIEDFQGQGIGPRTLNVLHELKATTQGRPEAKVFDAQPQEPEQPPPPSPEEQERILAEARANALAYTSGLPDFICLQVTRRYVDPSGLEMDWLKQDEIKTRVSYFDKHENYEVISVNNRITNAGILDLGGAASTGEFGSMLAQLFDSKTAADFRWARHSLLRGRAVYVFQFRVPRHRSRWTLSVEHTGKIITAYKGLVYIDKETERVLRVYEEAEDIPRDFPIRSAQTRLDYDYAEINGSQYLLPLKARVRMRQGKLLARNEVEFRLYRKFSADAVISFDEIDDLPPLPEEEGATTP